MTEKPKILDPVWKAEDAIHQLKVAPIGSSIIVYVSRGEKHLTDQEMQKVMIEGGITASVESWPTVSEKPGTYEYRVVKTQ